MIFIPGLHADVVLACRVAAPREAVGLVLVADGVAIASIRLPNAAEEPETSFALEPVHVGLWALLERTGLEIVPYHSHVDAPAWPGEHDMRGVRPGDKMLIYSVQFDELRAFTFERSDHEMRRSKLRPVELDVVTLPYTAIGA